MVTHDPITRRGFLGALGAGSLAGATGRPDSTGGRITGGRAGRGRERPGLAGWERTYGGDDDDVARSVVGTPDGGYLVGGFTDSVGAGFYDAWLLKVGPNGDRAWERTYGGGAIDRGVALVAGSDGGYLLAGNTRSAGSGRTDAWLARVDARGNETWSRTYGTGVTDEARALVAAEDGGYLLAGYTQSGDGGRGDAWLVKVAADGTEQWSRTFGRLLRDTAESAVQASDGGFMLVGNTASKGTGLFDAWLLRVDADGNRTWDRTYGGQGPDFATSVVSSGDGYLVAGATGSDGGGVDAWLLRVDGEGNRVWDRTHGGDGEDRVRSLARTADGGALLAGYTTSTGAGGRDAWVVRVDGEGERVWDRTYGGEGRDGAAAVVEREAGGAVLAGTTTAGGHGERDALLARAPPGPPPTTTPTGGTTPDGTTGGSTPGRSRTATGTPPTATPPDGTAGAGNTSAPGTVDGESLPGPGVPAVLAAIAGGGYLAYRRARGDDGD